MNFILKWLEETFLPYLTDWENNVKSIPGIKDSEMKQMLLSQETREGLKFTSTCKCHVFLIIFFSMKTSIL